MKKLTTAEFIRRSKEIHGDKYNYSKVDYINSSLPVEIICKLHGPFFQSLESHMRQQQGCHKCNGGTHSNTKEFIQKAIAVHGNKYNYSKVNYINNRTKINIVCSIHDVYLQTPHDHLAGNGCNLCNNISKTNCTMFIDKANKTHNFKYKYFPDEYIDYKTKTKIECPFHGIFIKSPSSHVNGRGCSICGGCTKMNAEEFINKATRLYGDTRYDYKDVIYVNNKTKVKIKCLKCNDYFLQRPNDHLSTYGCPFCISTISKNEIKLLDYIEIPNTTETRQVRILNKKVDGYDPKSNIIYEFLGDYWHGNPKLYKSTDINKRTGTTFGELYNNTFDRFQLFKDNGYIIKYIWEMDWKIWKSSGLTELPLTTFGD